jgi:hypothetical protein
MTPKIIIKELNTTIEGDFDFKVSPVLLNGSLEPVKNISFNFNVEMLQDLYPIYQSEAYEIFAEKVKQDLIKFLTKTI